MITGFRLLRVLLGVLAVMTIACQRVPLLAPAGSTITLTASATTLPLNGTTMLIAQVIKPAGTPPEQGTLVTFTTSLGTIQPANVETDVNGQATVQFSAGTLSGTATITAISGGVSVGTAGAIKIAIGAAAVANLGLNAFPASIAPGGNSAITATVSDPSGNVLAGVPVTFSTDNGSMSSSVVTTDAGGHASAVLTTTKTAKVTATAGIGSSATSGTTTTTTAAPSASVTVTVEPLPTASITTTGNAPQVNVPVTFTITAQTGTGGSATIQNVSVNFGDGGGDQSLGAATGTTSVQHVYDSAGSKTASVTVTDSNGGRTSASTIVFVQTQAPIVSLTYNSSSNGVTTTANFTATVTPAGTSVAQYVWSFGDGQSQTTFNNTVSHPYVTASLPKTATVTITTTTNQTASSSTTVTP
jgi:hypothetical protein